MMHFYGSKGKAGAGVRQGDHLSPLMFVLAADLLQSILNKTMSLGEIRFALSKS